MSTVAATDAAFEKFLIRFSLEIARYFRRRRAHEPEDLVQSVLVVLWRNRHTYDPAKGPMRPWAYAIARREFSRKVRQEVARPPVLGSYAIDPDTAPDGERWSAADWTVTDPIEAISIARGEEPKKPKKHYPKKAEAMRRTPAELAVVARVRAMRAEGILCKDISQLLAREGILSRRKRPFSTATLYDMGR